MPTTTPPRKGGQPRYGWRWQRGALVPDEREQAIRWLILHMHAQGFSLARIAAELRALNIPTREGGEWPRTNLHRVIATARQLADTG